MENSPLSIIKYLVVSIVLIFFCSPANAQKSPNKQSYEFDFAPDLWYNTVDGIRAGIRMRGQQSGTFFDGPHRLDMGVWLSTNIPDYPVSYYLSFTEPIPSISGFNSEGNVQLRSSIRTGYHNHSLSLNKRWQPGFDEQNYRELSVSFRAEKRFEDEYLLFPQIWQSDWLYIGGVDFVLNNSNPLGRYRLQSTTSVNLAGNYDQFVNTKASFQQIIPFGEDWTLRTRIFGGVSSDDTAPEYRFSNSMKPYTEWDNLGSTRAKGTLPTPWMRDGFIQIAGGPNLRGYTSQDIESLENGGAPLHTSVGALNVEFEYPNPIDKALNSIPFAGLLNFRSYLFFDAGTADETLADAGPGFMLNINIPDYLGKSRGFALRYEIPLWLSHPSGDDPHFKYRSLIGIGAVISL